MAGNSSVVQAKRATGVGRAAVESVFVSAGMPIGGTAARAMLAGLSSGSVRMERKSAPVTPPLRVIHVGQSMVRAGIEQWLQGLIRFSDPTKLEFVRCIATTELVDPVVVGEMGVPVEIGQAESVRRAAQDCDVLLCWGPPEMGKWLGKTRAPLTVFVAHGESQWTRNILDGCAPIVDHVVAVSRRVEEKVCQGFPTTVIRNGIDARHVAQSRPRDQVRQELGFQPTDYVVGYVGRFSSEKRPEIVIEEVARMPADVKALLVGWGADGAELLRLANEKIPGRYAFVTADSHLGDYYAAMDAFCLPSAIEGFALVVLEAMMCGKPVIVTPVGCVPEVIQDRVNGLVVSGEPGTVASAVELLRAYPRWAEGLAAEGKRYADEHGHAWRMAREYEALLARLWAERQVQLAAKPAASHRDDRTRPARPAGGGKRRATAANRSTNKSRSQPAVRRRASRKRGGGSSR